MTSNLTICKDGTVHLESCTAAAGHPGCNCPKPMTDKMTRDEVMAALRYAAELVPDADAAPTYGAIAAVSALFDEVEALRDALHKLIDAASDSDSCRYGTLGTSFVRSIAEEALARCKGGA